MNKRTFIKLSSTLMAAPIILPIKDFAQDEKLVNWAGNIEYSTGNISYPESVEEVQQLIKKHGKLKVLGTRHCFNRLADSKDYFVSSRKLNKIISLDKDAHTVTVEGGIKYGELCPWLNDKGYALHNLASLPHISVAGAIATATHGSGIKNGNLATAVSGLEIVLADGSIVHLTKKDGETFHAAVVGLGALGMVTKVTLNVQPTFMMRQYVYERLPLQQLQQHFDDIEGAGYSVSLFTDWGSDSINEVWVKSRVDDAANSTAKDDFFGAKPATHNLHPIAALSAENCTAQMGVPGPWYERMPHFKMGFTPSSGKELQTEYFVPHQHAVEAIMAIQQLGKSITPHLFISEIRTIAADDLWMSPAYQQDSVALHFTWKQEWDAVSKLLPQIEQALAPFNPRPHWGKLFTMAPTTLDSRYTKLTDFKQLVAKYDPNGKFRNAFLEEKLYSA
jgi:xylitol oxidase